MAVEQERWGRAAKGSINSDNSYTSLLRRVVFPAPGLLFTASASLHLRNYL